MAFGYDIFCLIGTENFTLVETLGIGGNIRILVYLVLEMILHFVFHGNNICWTILQLNFNLTHACFNISFKSDYFTKVFFDMASIVIELWLHIEQDECSVFVCDKIFVPHLLVET